VWSSNFVTTALVQEKTTDRRRSYGTISARSGHGDDAVWTKSLFTFYGPQANWLTLDELLDSPHSLETVVYKGNEAGKDLVYIDLIHEKARQEIWLDPAANYLACRVVTHAFLPPGSPSKESLGEAIVTRFKEVQPAIYFPKSVEVRHLSEGNVVPSVTTMNVFYDLHVNQPISDEFFHPRFPLGIEVVDSINDRVLLVQPNGDLKQIPGKTLSKVAPLQIGTESQTLDEPVPWTTWLIPLSLLVLGAAAGILVYRTLRLRLRRPA
jgi:hypothetical protein